MEETKITSRVGMEMGLSYTIWMIYLHSSWKKEDKNTNKHHSSLVSHDNEYRSDNLFAFKRPRPISDQVKEMFPW